MHYISDLKNHALLQVHHVFCFTSKFASYNPPCKEHCLKCFSVSNGRYQPATSAPASTAPPATTKRRYPLPLVGAHHLLADAYTYAPPAYARPNSAPQRMSYVTENAHTSTLSAPYPPADGGGSAQSSGSGGQASYVGAPAHRCVTMPLASL